MKKIDMHCHTSNRIIKDVIDGDASIENISAYMKKYGIEETILLATYFPHKSSGISNFRLLNWIKKNTNFKMFGSLDFEFYFFQGLNELEELTSKKLIHGIKIYTCYQNIDIHSDQMKLVLKLARKHNLPVMFHTGYSYSSMRKYNRITVGTPHSAKSLSALAKDYPDITFIFSHLSKPFFHEMMLACIAHKNVYTDVSGIIDSSYDEIEIPICISEIKMFLENCSHKQLLFGTDFPVQTHEHSIRFIEESISDEKIKEDVYYNNAKSILENCYEPKE